MKSSSTKILKFTGILLSISLSFSRCMPKEEEIPILPKTPCEIFFQESQNDTTKLIWETTKNFNLDFQPILHFNQNRPMILDRLSGSMLILNPQNGILFGTLNKMGHISSIDQVFSSNAYFFSFNNLLDLSIHSLTTFELIYQRKHQIKRIIYNDDEVLYFIQDENSKVQSINTITLTQPLLFPKTIKLWNIDTVNILNACIIKNSMGDDYLITAQEFEQNNQKLPRLQAFDLNKNIKLWELPLSNKWETQSTFVLPIKNNIYFNTSQFSYLANGLTGEILYKSNRIHRAKNPPKLIGDAIILLNSSDKTIYCLNVDNLTVRWANHFPPKSDLDFFTQVYKNHLVINTDTEYQFYDLSDGALYKKLRSPYFDCRNFEIKPLGSSTGEIQFQAPFYFDERVSRIYSVGDQKVFCAQINF